MEAKDIPTFGSIGTRYATFFTSVCEPFIIISISRPKSKSRRSRHSGHSARNNSYFNLTQMKKLIFIMILAAAMAAPAQVIAPQKSLQADPFTREQYLQEYKDILKLEVAATNVWLMVSIIPMNQWDPAATRVFKPLVQFPAMAFTFAKTIEYTVHTTTGRAPKRWIRQYTPRMQAERAFDRFAKTNKMMQDSTLTTK